MPAHIVKSIMSLFFFLEGGGGGGYNCLLRGKHIYQCFKTNSAYYEDINDTFTRLK